MGRQRHRDGTFAVQPDAHLGPRRAVSQPDIVAIRRLRTAGWRPEALARVYGVSERTIYRYTRPTLEVDLRVGAWIGTFSIRAGRPPKQVGQWRPA